jgi:hypothetical protein
MEADTLCLSEIARRVGCPVRQIRYAVYHGLAPGLESHGRGYGFARRFSQSQAVWIAAAGLLIHAGLRREATRRILLLTMATTGSATIRSVADTDGTPTSLTAANGTSKTTNPDKRSSRNESSIVVVNIDIRKIRALLKRPAV